MKKPLLFLLFFLQTLLLFAQDPSDVEHAFGSIPGFDGQINNIKKQPDGKIIVAGSFEKFQGKIQRCIIRLNTNGSKDNSFNIGEGFLSANSSSVYSISLQNDGKIIAGGNFSSYNGISQRNLVRLNTDGSIDNTFKTGNAFNSYGGTVISIATQKDGKILVGGNFTKFGGITQNYLIRLNGDGTVDNSFDIGTGFNNSVRAINIQEDGKILVVGSFTSYKGINSNRIIRLNSDGTKDLTFDIGTGFQGFHGYTDTSLSSIIQQSDGKILVGGDFTFFNGNRINSLVRLNIDGSKDNSFDIGSGFNGSILSIAIDKNNKIIAGGSFNTFQNNNQSYLIRLNIDGSKDNSLDLKTGFSNSIFSIEIQNDEKIIVGGAFYSYQETYQSRLLRLDSNGDRDDSFNLGNGFNDDVRFISMQKDGKLILSGYFNTYQSTKNKYFIRLKADGNLDKSFKTGDGFNKYVWATAVQSDQKILVGGAFDSYDGVPEPYLIRLNSDGSKDKTFNLGSGFNSSVTSILIQKDGKILVKGPFTSFQGNTQKYLIRLNQDGSRDTSFNINNELVNEEIGYIFLQNDGKILITNRIETDKFILIRLNNDGSQDNTFNMTAQSRISSIAQQNDGKILIGSQFDFYNGDPKQYLIRLNSDGTKDLTFNNSNEFFSTNTLFSTEITNIAIQNDGKIIAGGFFPNSFGLRSGVIRLNSDGSADNTFNMKTFHSEGITSMILEPNGKIIIGGSFELYNGSNGYNDSAFLIRLFGDYISTPIVPKIITTNISCASSSGSASIEVYGGKSPYTYLWSNGSTASKITELAVGDYSCTVTDADLTTTIENFSIITSADTEKPTITGLADISTNITSGCTATGVTLGTPLTADNCSVVSVTNDAPLAFPIGNTIVTWTVKDANNNTATATQIVTVKDAILPTIEAPASITVNTDTNCTTTGVTLGTPITADNCSISSVTNNAPSTFPLGNTTVTWTVKDASNNIATATQIVTVKDAILPTIKAPAAVTVNTNVNCTATNVLLGTPVTADNCTVASVTNNAPSAFPIGETIVTWTVKDANNNTATATQIVTVKDAILPTIKAPAAITVNTNVNCTATSVLLGTPVTSDNCTVASVTNNAPSTFPLGNTTVTWTVKDASNNTATATQIVTVKDMTLPTIKAPAAITVNTNVNCTANSVLLGTPVTSDNCTVASVTNNAPSAFPVGETIVTWTVKDGSNNSATATQIVTVKGVDTTVKNNAGILTAVESRAIYKWLECNNGTFTAIPNENKVSFTPKKTGSYAIEITKNGCTITSTCYEVKTLGTEDFNLENSLKLYPNPSKDFVIIEVNPIDNTKLKVFDVNGHFILSKELKTESTTVDISHLSTGVYLFEISNETGKTIKKVIKK